MIASSYLDTGNPFDSFELHIVMAEEETSTSAMAFIENFEEMSAACPRVSIFCILVLILI